MTASETPKRIYLKDYQPPAFLVESLKLTFELHPTQTQVTAQARYRRNPDAQSSELILDGEELKLISIQLDSQALTPEQYTLDQRALTLSDLPESFSLEIQTEINPEANSTLEGLYLSNGSFCTQCEALGFRRITYFQDRPDVMTRYETTIIADKKEYPVLLSNGNLLSTQEIDAAKHSATWEDPFNKPAYLFALVAGDLDHIEDSFTTCSGRDVALKIYTEAHNIPKVPFAMEALKRSMKWDEEVYGREYDLEIFNIVAVDHFNFGAMENKSLNIFNSQAILADSQTATDSRFKSIEAIVAHEYFHNWSGNRVTLRDWFQLSLKEGFTVFRDACFTSDMTSWSVKRIEDVGALRSAQFPVDSGPTAHPIRPDSVITIENFYTTTVYEKGAEVIGMYHTLLGPEGFRKGSDLYFERHDGCAVTCDDFVAAMEDANNIDLTQFRNWYSQAGTPEVLATDSYDNEKQSYSLTLKQSCPPTPGQPVKPAFVIPVKMGLVNPQGKDIPLQLEGETTPQGTTRLLILNELEQTFVFQNVSEKPLPSLLRDFSAPVKLTQSLTDAERAHLLAHDSNEFNRWEAGQQLALDTILQLLKAHQNGETLTLNTCFIEAYRKLLINKTLDKQFLALALLLPTQNYIEEWVEVIDPVAIYTVRQFVRTTLAKALQSEFTACYHENAAHEPYAYEQSQVGKRTLRNTCLHYLTLLEDTTSQTLCVKQYNASDNMTDSLAAITALGDKESTVRSLLLAQFYDQWKSNTNVIVQWFALNAYLDSPTVISEIETLMSHTAFDIKNANMVRALLGTFISGNIQFHADDGSGYCFIRKQIVDFNQRNKKVAARLVSAFRSWKRYSPERQALIKPELESIVAMPGVTDDVFEMAKNILEN